jgi:hypothetical protein
MGQPMRRLELKHFEDMHGVRLRADDGPADRKHARRVW